MLSKYFLKITKTAEFRERLLNLTEKLKDKKVILYGAGEGFFALKNEYDFSTLNIVAIADQKFTEETTTDGMRAIRPLSILNQDYDVILITNEYYEKILKYLSENLQIKDKEIYTVFEHDIKDESISYNYTERFNFADTLPKIKAKLKGKTVVIYGAGVFFQAIKKYYDLNGLNIIGISDKKFIKHELNEEFLGYKVYSPDEIRTLKPDYVLLASKFYIKLFEELYFKTLKGTGIKIKPLLRKDFITLIKEAWSCY